MDTISALFPSTKLENPPQPPPQPSSSESNLIAITSTPSISLPPPPFINSINEFRSLSTALSTFVSRYDELINHLNFIKLSIDAKLPHHLIDDTVNLNQSPFTHLIESFCDQNVTNVTESIVSDRNPNGIGSDCERSCEDSSVNERISYLNKYEENDVLSNLEEFDVSNKLLESDRDVLKDSERIDISKKVIQADTNVLIDSEGIDLLRKLVETNTDVLKNSEGIDVSNKLLEADTDLLKDSESVDVSMEVLETDTLTIDEEIDVSKNNGDIEVSNKLVETDTLKIDEGFDVSNKLLEADTDVLKDSEAVDMSMEVLETDTLMIDEEIDVSKNYGDIEVSNKLVETEIDEGIDVSKKLVETDTGVLKNFEQFNLSMELRQTDALNIDEEMDVSKIDEEIDVLKKHEEADKLKIDKENYISKMDEEIDVSKKDEVIDVLVDHEKISKEYEQTDILMNKEEIDTSVNHEELETLMNNDKFDILNQPEKTDLSMDHEEIDSLKNNVEAVFSKKQEELDPLRKQEETDYVEKHEENFVSKKPSGNSRKRRKEAFKSKKLAERHISKNPSNFDMKENDICKKQEENSDIEKHEKIVVSRKPESSNHSKKHEEIVVSREPKSRNSLKKNNKTDVSKKHKEIDILKSNLEIGVEENDVSKTHKEKKLEEIDVSKKAKENDNLKNLEKIDISKNHDETDVLKKHKKISVSKTREEIDPLNKSAASELETLCARMNAKRMKKYLKKHITDMNKLREELPKALKLAKDPVKLVLDCIGRHNHGQVVSRLASVMILECFVVMISSDGIEISKDYKAYAAEAAVKWKQRMVKDGGVRRMEEADARGLLLLISGFGIPDRDFKIVDITDLIMASNAKEISAALRRSIILIPKIPEVIDMMVKNNLEIEAADTAYTFGLEDKCQPLIILTVFLRKKIRDIQNGSPFQMLKAMEQQLYDLKSVKQCLEFHKVDPSNVLPDFKIDEKIRYLEKEITNMNLAPKRKSTELEHLENPIHHEAKHTCLSHEENDVSKTGEEIDVSKKDEVIDILVDHEKNSKEYEQTDILVNKEEIDTSVNHEELETLNSDEETDASKLGEEFDVLKKHEEADKLKIDEENDVLKIGEEFDVSKKDEVIDVVVDHEIFSKEYEQTDILMNKEEIDTSLTYEELETLMNNDIIDMLNQHGKTDLSVDYEEVDSLKNNVEADFSKKQEEIDTLKKQEKINSRKRRIEAFISEKFAERDISKNPLKIDMKEYDVSKKQEENSEEIDTSKKSADSELETLCATMDAKGMKKYLKKHITDMNILREELPKALKLATDPAKLVLDSIGSYFLQPRKTYHSGNHHGHVVSRLASVMILESFVMISSDGIEISKDYKAYAAEAAVKWKQRMVKEGGVRLMEEADVRGLLLLISGFGIRDCDFKIVDITDLIMASNVKGISAALRRSIILIQKISEVIDMMVKNNLEIEAADTAYTFGLEDKCQPLIILTVFLRKKIRDIQNGSPFQMLKAMEQQLYDLKSVKLCLEFHKVDPSNVLPDFKIDEKIRHLEKEITNMNLAPKRKSTELEHLENPIHHEAKRTCLSHEENDVSKTGEEIDVSKKEEVIDILVDHEKISKEYEQTDILVNKEEIDSSVNHEELETLNSDEETDASKLGEEFDVLKKHEEADKSKIDEENDVLKIGEEFDVSKKDEVIDVVVDHEIFSKEYEQTDILMNKEEIDTSLTYEELETLMNNDIIDMLNQHGETDLSVDYEEVDSLKNNVEADFSKKQEEIDTLKKQEKTDYVEKHEENFISKNPKSSNSRKRRIEAFLSKKLAERDISKNPLKIDMKENDVSKKQEENSDLEKHEKIVVSRKPESSNHLKKHEETVVSRKPKSCNSLKKNKKTDVSKKHKEIDISKSNVEIGVEENDVSKMHKVKKLEEIDVSKKAKENDNLKNLEKIDISKNHKETDVLKKHKNFSVLKTREGIDTLKKSAASELETLCARMDGKRMKEYLKTHITDMNKLREELPKALKLARDPAKLVLDSVGRYFLQPGKTYHNGHHHGNVVSRLASVMILECFVMISSDISKEGKAYAAESADKWKQRMVKEGGARRMEEADARGLLLLISGFGIPDHDFKIVDIMDLIMASNVKGISVALRCSNILIPKIPEVIDMMVKNNLEIEAADTAYTFGLEDKCQPLIILTVFLHKKIRDIQNGSPFQMLKAMEQQLYDLKSVKLCLEFHKVDPSNVLPDFKIDEKIRHLEKEITNMNLAPKRKSTELEHLENPIHHEAKRTCLSHEENDVSKTGEEIDVSKKEEVIDILVDHEKISKEYEQTDILVNKEEIDSSVNHEELETLNSDEETDASKLGEEFDVLKKHEEADKSKIDEENDVLKIGEEFDVSKKDEVIDVVVDHEIFSKEYEQTDILMNKEEIDTSLTYEELETLMNNDIIDMLNQHGETDLSVDYEEVDSLKNNVEADFSKKQEEIDTLKKQEKMNSRKRRIEAFFSKKLDISKNPLKIDMLKNHKETDVLKKHKKFSVLKTREGIDTLKESAASELETLCARMDGKRMKKYLKTHITDMNKLREELPKALKLATDPAKLVLGSIDRFFLQPSKTYQCRNHHEQVVSRLVSVMILECFVLISSEGIEISKEDKAYAEESAVRWKQRMVKEGGVRHMEEADARGLLLLISGFRIPDRDFKIVDITDLIMASNVRGISVALRRSIILIPKIPEVIDMMVKNNLEIEAADTAYTFGLEDKCQPLIILTVFLRKKIRDIQNGSPFQMVKAMKQQLYGLKSVKQCLEFHKVEPSNVLPDFKINEKIRHLEKEITNMNLTPKRKSTEPEHSENPIHHEAKRPCFSHENMPHRQNPVVHYPVKPYTRPAESHSNYINYDRGLAHNRGLVQSYGKHVYGGIVTNQMARPANVQPYGWQGDPRYINNHMGQPYLSQSQSYVSQPYVMSPPESNPGFPARRAPADRL